MKQINLIEEIQKLETKRAFLLIENEIYEMIDHANNGYNFKVTTQILEIDSDIQVLKHAERIINRHNKKEESNVCK